MSGPDAKSAGALAALRGWRSLRGGGEADEDDNITHVLVFISDFAWILLGHARTHTRARAHTHTHTLTQTHTPVQNGSVIASTDPPAQGGQTPSPICPPDR